MKHRIDSDFPNGRRCDALVHAARRFLVGAAFVCVPLLSLHAGASERVTVQAVGLHTMSAGTALEVAHRHALQDALRNALHQAGASVDSHARVEGQMLVERSLTVRTHGSVESVRVLASGVLADRPEVYRVLVDAVVRQGDQPEVAAYGGDTWRPRVMLRLDSGQPLNVVMSHGPQLQRALANSGIEVVEDIDEPGALVLDLKLRSLGSVTLNGNGNAQESDADVFDVAWTIGYPAENGVDVGLAERPLAASGEWMVAIGAGSAAVWWDRFAVQMAQHALRLWNSPHWVEVTVYGLAAEDMPTLERLPGVELGQRRAEAEGQLSVTYLRLPVRGNAGIYVVEALRGVGLDGRLEPVSIAGQGLEFLAKR